MSRAAQTQSQLDDPSATVQPVVPPPEPEPGASDDVLDVRGAMLLLKLGRNAIYDACGRKQIPHRRIGRHIRFSRAALLRWLGAQS